jgi:hypothetical protein
MTDAERLRRVGLCASCRHAKRIVSSKGSEFWLCGRAERDPAFRKYPPLPVIRCAGYEKLILPPPASSSKKSTD